MTIPSGLEARLGDSVARAIPGMSVMPGRTAVRVDGVRSRPRSTLIRATVGEGPEALELVVKIPHLVERWATSRPRIVPDTAPTEKAVLEAATLRAIHESLAADPDPRFGSVRIIDVYEDIAAIVMTAAAGTPLRRLLVRAAWRGIDRTANRALSTALESAGAWLRRFQGLDIGRSRPIRVATRAQLIDLAEAIGDHLASSAAMSGVRRDAIRVIVARFAAAADATLPAVLPSALHHGDFAVRNVLLDGDRTVTTIDALGRWRMPRYDDLARWLVDLETSRLQTTSFGLALAPRQRAAFGEALLGGYGATDVDRAAVRTYAAFLTLDRWAAVADARASGSRRRARLPGGLVDRHFEHVGRGFLAPENGGRSGGF